MPQATAESGATGATTQSDSERIASLDIVRGVAVMGILAMNIVAFAMPQEAYMNPTSFGWDSASDRIAWVFSFIFVDGKMRGLFAFLFGASMLLVIERAEASGAPAARIHFARMIWLLAFGLAHFYFIWWGDILAHYAMIGMIAWFLHHKTPRALVRIGLILIAIQVLITGMISASAFQMASAATAPGASSEAIEAWRSFSDSFVIADPEELGETLALYRGGLSGIVAHQFTEELFAPLFFLAFGGWETLAYMLFGMAMLKNGFLAGGWPPRRYARIAAICLALGIPLYALLAWGVMRAAFSVPAIFAIQIAGASLVRPVLIVAYAALIILAARRGGPLVDRIAAAGRAAFTNYLGTSIVMVLFFYGYGLGMYGRLGRAELWLVVIAGWALMLLWSKPWLDRYNYGPFEWLWRSLARGKLQPMRKNPRPAAA